LGFQREKKNKKKKTKNPQRIGRRLKKKKKINHKDKRLQND